MMKSAKTVLGLALIGMVGLASADSVFTWQGNGGNKVYSDTPRNLNTRNVGTMNIRSHTVTKLDNETKSGSIEGGKIGTTADSKEPSLAEQQADVSAKIAAENKKKEEENKKIDEQNKQAQTENCTRAQLNLNNVQTSNRVNNREQLAAGYQQDIDRFCK